MGNLNSQFINDFVLSYQSTHAPTPAYTIKISQTRWAAVYKGLPSNRSNIEDEMVILDGMTFYSISILSTEEPIDEWVYLEIYQDFKGTLHTSMKFLELTAFARSIPMDTMVFTSW